MWLTGHPGWHTTADRALHFRAVTAPESTLTGADPGTGLPVFATGEIAALMSVGIEEGKPWCDPGNAEASVSTLVLPECGPQELTAALASIRWVGHVAVADLWEAVAGAVVRTASDPGRARAVWQRFCLAHGDLVVRDGLRGWRFPRPRQVLVFPVRAFTTTGALTAMRSLRTAARACADHTEQWQHLSAAALLDALLDVPHLSARAAGIAVADYTGDYSHHPLDEPTQQAIRHLVPGRDWPHHDDDAFRRAWHQLTAGDHAVWNRWVCAWRLAHHTPTTPPVPAHQAGG